MPTATVSGDAPQSFSNAWRWSVLSLLTLGCIIAYVDRVNLSVAVIDAYFLWRMSDAC